MIYFFFFIRRIIYRNDDTQLCLKIIAIRFAEKSISITYECIINKTYKVIKTIEKCTFSLMHLCGCNGFMRLHNCKQRLANSVLECLLHKENFAI